nr:hypothetical protein [Micromonospora pisi]
MPVPSGVLGVAGDEPVAVGPVATGGALVSFGMSWVRSDACMVYPGTDGRGPVGSGALPGMGWVRSEAPAVVPAPGWVRSGVFAGVPGMGWVRSGDAAAVGMDCVCSGADAAVGKPGTSAVGFADRGGPFSGKPVGATVPGHGPRARAAAVGSTVGVGGRGGAHGLGEAGAEGVVARVPPGRAAGPASG